MKLSQKDMFNTINVFLFVCGCFVFLEANGQRCTCVGNCIVSNACAPDDNCNKVNVAFGKNASMSSIYNDGEVLETSGPACLAINGNTTTVFAPININPNSPNCISTSQYDINATWQVDLGQVYAIHSITIYMRRYLQERMSGVNVLVDGVLCYDFKTVTASTFNKDWVDFTCNPALSGRVVQLAKNNNELPPNKVYLRLIDVCEVQVWVCKPGLYGTHCDQVCDVCANNATCNGWDGSCPKLTTRESTLPLTATTTTDTISTATPVPLATTSIPTTTTLPTLESTTAQSISPRSAATAKLEDTSSIEDKNATEGGTGKEDTSKGEFPLYPVIGAAVGGGVLTIIIVLVLCVILRKKRGHKSEIHELQERSQGRRDSEAQSVYVIKKESKKQAAVKPAFLRPPTNTLLGHRNGYTNFGMNVHAADSLDTGHESDDASDYVVVYDEDDSAYAGLKEGSAQMDNAQRCLVDLLASGTLPDKFNELPKGLLHAHEAGEIPINRSKNRVLSILPYDYNRVVLKDGYVAMEATDYINASYIQGYQDRNAYIAAQGPRDNTVCDFWRMVWQEQITQIVMLTGVSEAEKNHCWEYWPLRDSSETHGQVTVTGVQVQKRACFLHRTFLLKAEGSSEELEVDQYHFLMWPDQGVPSVTSLVSLWRLIRARAPQHPPPPVVVHCSNGAGRTGTYIGLDIAMQHLRLVGEVDVVEIVKQLRQERCWMVQDVEHFVFLHKLLLEAYTGRDTKMAFDLFDATFSRPISAKTPLSRIDKEFQTLMWMHKLTAKRTCTVAEHHENVTKNRNRDSLPADENLVLLKRGFAGRNKYINAVFLSTFRARNGNILTQLPLPDTLVDFWRMIDENDAKIIVSLGSEEEERNTKDYCRYWPRPPSEVIQTGVYTVTLQNVSKIGDHLTSFAVSLNAEHFTDGSRDLRVLHFEGWEGEVPANTSELLHLLDTLESTRAQFGSNPVVIQCLDGSAKSGLFSALCDTITRVTHDKEIDVYMTTRELHNVRPQAVTSVVQYRYCYEVAQRRVKNLIVQNDTTLGAHL